MQQHYPTNIDNDPIRANILLRNNDPIRNNTQVDSRESERGNGVMPRKNLFNMMKNKGNDTTFNSSNNQQHPDIYRENIFTENYNRNDSLNEEMIEKDKRIQELEFKLQQIEFEKESFKNKLGIIKKYEEDNKNLSLKLKQEYEKNKEMIIIQNKLSLFEKSKGVDDKIISELTKKLNETENDEEIALNVIDTIDVASDDEEIKDIDYDEIYKKTLEAENKRNLNLDRYKNDKLKGMISKYLKNVNGKTIDDTFIKMKIDENATITKDLISRIIYEIKQ
jgi:hypothetical protein|tara:strand:+ start:552 stop:1388 length:837 start_codon:yes stop_codon:yes gene_type:complete